MIVRAINVILERAYRLRCKVNIYRTAGIMEARSHDPLRLEWISPQALTREIPGPDFRNHHTPGVIVGGDWDLTTIDVHRAHLAGFHQRYVEGRPWVDTVLFQDAVGRSPGNYWHGCRTRSEIVARLQWYDLIHDSIARDGYLTQRELANRDCPTGGTRLRLLPPELGEIIVHVDRNGNYIFDDGRHRLSIAKILGLKKIPVLVVARHRLWYEASGMKLLAGHSDSE